MQHLYNKLHTQLYSHKPHKASQQLRTHRKHELNILLWGFWGFLPSSSTHFRFLKHFLTSCGDKAQQMLPLVSWIWGWTHWNSVCELQGKCQSFIKLRARYQGQTLMSVNVLLGFEVIQRTSLIIFRLEFNHVSVITQRSSFWAIFSLRRLDLIFKKTQPCNALFSPSVI